MSQSTDPAWQGAAKVAESRLRTIDQALAALEAAVPGVTDDTQKPQPQLPAGPSPMTQFQQQQNTSNHMADELAVAQVAAPTQIPHSSLQALDTFLAGAL